jgi:hypothetical protein
VSSNSANMGRVEAYMGRVEAYMGRVEAYMGRVEASKTPMPMEATCFVQTLGSVSLLLVLVHTFSSLTITELSVNLSPSSLSSCLIISVFSRSSLPIIICFLTCHVIMHLLHVKTCPELLSDMPEMAHISTSPSPELRFAFSFARYTAVSGAQCSFMSLMHSSYQRARNSVHVYEHGEIPNHRVFLHPLGVGFNIRRSCICWCKIKSNGTCYEKYRTLVAYSWHYACVCMAGLGHCQRVESDNSHLCSMFCIVRACKSRTDAYYEPLDFDARDFLSKPHDSLHATKARVRWR